MEYLMIDQIQIFWYSFILGLGLGFIYDIFRIFRLVFNSKKWSIFFQDILYFIIISLITFFYIIIFNKGEIRFYILIGQFIGWIIYYVSIGRIVYKYSKSCLSFIRKICTALFYPLKSILNKFSHTKLFKFNIKKEKI